MHATTSTADRTLRPTKPTLLEQTRERGSSVARVRESLARADLDCRCRGAAETLLTRFSREEDLVRRAEALAEARRMCGSIVAVIALLGDLNDLTPDAPAFSEMADLFRDIREFAEHGTSAAKDTSTPIPIASEEC